MASLAEVVEAALNIGINLHGRDYASVFRLDTWQTDQTLPTREQINSTSRRVMLKIATDKKETRTWSQEEELQAAEMYRKLLEARESFLEYIKTAPADIRNPEGRKKHTPWMCLELGATMIIWLRTMFPGQKLYLRTSALSGPVEGITEQDMEETRSILHDMHAEDRSLRAIDSGSVIWAPTNRAGWGDILQLLNRTSNPEDDHVELTLVLPSTLHGATPETIRQLGDEPVFRREWDHKLSGVTVLNPPIWMISSTPRGPVRLLRTMVLLQVSSKPGPSMATTMRTTTWNTAHKTFGEMYSFQLEMPEEAMSEVHEAIATAAEGWNGWADAPFRAPGTTPQHRVKATLVTLPTGEDGTSVEEVIKTAKDKWGGKGLMICSQDLLNDPTAMILEVTSMQAIRHAFNLIDEARSISPTRVLLSSTAPAHQWEDIMGKVMNNNSLTEGLLALRSRNGALIAKPPVLPEQISAKRAASRAAKAPTLPNGVKITPPLITTIRAMGISKSTPAAVVHKVQAALKEKLPDPEKIEWVDNIPRKIGTGSPMGMLGTRQKKWDGTIRIASHEEPLHEAIFTQLDGFTVTMGMSVICCQVSNTEGKMFQIKQAIV